MNMRYRAIVGTVTAAAAWLILGCSAATRPPTPATRPAETPPTLPSQAGEKSLSSWEGVYTSPSEIGGFSSTVLSLEEEFGGRGLRARMRSRSDVVDVNKIQEAEQHAFPLTDRDHLYLPKALGYVHDGKTSLLATVERYTRVTIQGHAVLMRDDALQAFRAQNRLYDYGILMKVLDKSDLFLDLGTAQHQSIKVLYVNATAPWADPFVHGPNQR